MAEAIGVVFSPGGKVYSFDPCGLELAWNDKVICQTARGKEHGRVVQANYTIPDEELKGRLKRVVRRATEEDERQVRENREEAKRSMAVFREVIAERNLPLKPVTAEVVFDGSRLVFSYGAEGRVETRAAQEELARRLRRRVELRSVGPREQARLCGGYGLCGTQLCCTRFPSHEQPIALRMAKEQDLPLSSGRITGLCGRLRCCLAFEHPLYKSFRDRAPRVGARVETPHGQGVVKGYEVLKDACVVELGDRKVDVELGDLRDLDEGARSGRSREAPEGSAGR